MTNRIHTITSVRDATPDFENSEVAKVLHKDPRIAAATLGNAISIMEEAYYQSGGFKYRLKLMELEEAWSGLKWDNSRISHILRRWFDMGYYVGY